MVKTPREKHCRQSFFVGSRAESAYDCLQSMAVTVTSKSTMYAELSDSRLITIGGGTSEVMREIIAKLKDVVRIPASVRFGVG